MCVCILSPIRWLSVWPRGLFNLRRSAEAPAKIQVKKSDLIMIKNLLIFAKSRVTPYPIPGASNRSPAMTGFSVMLLQTFQMDGFIAENVGACAASAHTLNIIFDSPLQQLIEEVGDGCTTHCQFLLLSNFFEKMRLRSGKVEPPLLTPTFWVPILFPAS